MESVYSDEFIAQVESFVLRLVDFYKPKHLTAKTGSVDFYFMIASGSMFSTLVPMLKEIIQLYPPHILKFRVAQLNIQNAGRINRLTGSNAFYSKIGELSLGEKLRFVSSKDLASFDFERLKFVPKSQRKNDDDILALSSQMKRKAAVTKGGMKRPKRKLDSKMDEISDHLLSLVRFKIPYDGKDISLKQFRAFVTDYFGEHLAITKMMKDAMYEKYLDSKSV